MSAQKAQKGVGKKTETAVGSEAPHGEDPAHESQRTGASWGPARPDPAVPVVVTVVGARAERDSVQT